MPPKASPRTAGTSAQNTAVAAGDSAEAGGAAAEGSAEDRRVGAERAATSADMERARAKADRIRLLAGMGVSPSAIARDSSVPVRAVRALLEESPPTGPVDPAAPAPPDEPPAPSLSKSTRERLEKAMAALGPAPRNDPFDLSNIQPPAPDGGAGIALGRNFSIMTNEDAFMKSALTFGVDNGIAAGIGIQFFNSGRKVSDYRELEAIIRRAGVRPNISSSIVSTYRSLVDPNAGKLAPGAWSPAGDEDDAITRTRQALLADRLERLEGLRLDRLERELVGGTGGASSAEPEVVRLRAELDVLKREKDQRALLDGVTAQLSAQIKPLQDQLAELRSRPAAGPKSLTDVQAGVYESVAAALIKTADNKLARSGAGQAFLQKLVAEVGPGWARKLSVELNPDGPPPEVLAATVPTEADLLLAAASLGGHPAAVEPETAPAQRTPSFRYN